MKTSEQNTSQLVETELRWFAVHTRFKSEKYVQRLLDRKGIHSYVPLQSTVKRYSRSLRTIETPLISCYVFVKISKEHYLPVLETEHVAGFIKFNQQLIAIPESEIEVMRRITLESDLELTVIPGSLQEGDNVEISAGSLVGMKGKIVKVEGKRKFQVELETLSYSLLITIDAAFLEKTGLPSF